MEIPIPFGRIVVGKNVNDSIVKPPTIEEKLLQIDQGIMKSELAENKLRGQRKQSETRATQHTRRAVDAHSSGNRTEEDVNVAHIAAARKEGEIVGQMEIQAAQLGSMFRLAQGVIRSEAAISESVDLLGALNLNPEIAESVGAINQAGNRILQITDSISSSLENSMMTNDADRLDGIRAEIAAEANARSAQPRGSSVEVPSSEEDLPA